MINLFSKKLTSISKYAFPIRPLGKAPNATAYEWIHPLGTTQVCRFLGKSLRFRAQFSVTTQKALQAITHGSSENIAYWQVINTNGGLITRFPGGVAGQAALLAEEVSSLLVPLARFHHRHKRESIKGDIL